MKPRARRILRGLIMNQTQAQIAEAENVTQSAVSQTLHNSGAIALLASTELLTEALA
jgi:predicted transcriptional regulator